MSRLIIQVKSQPALVGLDMKPARAPVRTRLASFSLNQELAQMRIENQRPQVTVDTRAGWGALAYMSPEELSLRLRNWAQQAAHDGVGRRAELGDRLADFWEPGNEVEALTGPDAEISPHVVTTSDSPISIYASPGSVTIDYMPGQSSVLLGQTPEASSYQPAALNIYLRQQAGVEISWKHINALA